MTKSVGAPGWCATGLAIAGAVSGASTWANAACEWQKPSGAFRFGDTYLDDPRNATNRAQAVLAVQAAPG